LRDYLPKIGMARWPNVAASLIHLTGYEIPVAEIKCRSCLQLLGSLAGSRTSSADVGPLLLEKCRDRLYPNSPPAVSPASVFPTK